MGFLSKLWQQPEPDHVKRLIRSNRLTGGDVADPQDWLLKLLRADPRCVTPAQALRIAAVYSCVRVRSEDFAKVPLYVYKKLAAGGKALATEHRLFEPLRLKPGIVQTSYIWRAMSENHRCLRGNTYSQIQFDGRGRAVGLYPLHPDRVDPIVDRITFKVFYRYRKINGEVFDVTADKILHSRAAVIPDGIRGLSPISECSGVMQKAIAIDVYGNAFFQNAARPGGVLKTTGEIDPEAVDQLKKDWKELYTGVNVGVLAVLENGLEFQQLGMKNNDAQFLETSDATQRDICGMMRVPPHKIGILDSTNRATMEEQNIEYADSTIAPICTEMAQEMEIKLLTQDERDAGYTIGFVLDGLYKGDSIKRATYYAMGKQNGWLSINDIRDKEDLKNIGPEGDVYLEPLNMVPAGTERSLPTAPTAQNGDPPQSTAGSGGSAEDVKNQSDTVGKRSLELIFQDYFAQIHRKEQTFLEKNGENRGKVADFYAGHGSFVNDKLLPAVVAACAGLDGDPAHVSRCLSSLEKFAIEAARHNYSLPPTNWDQLSEERAKALVTLIFDAKEGA